MTDDEALRSETDLYEAMRRSCALAMKDLLGSGYIDDYYLQHSSVFVGIAHGYAENLVMIRGARS